MAIVNPHEEVREVPIGEQTRRRFTEADLGLGPLLMERWVIE